MASNDATPLQQPAARRRGGALRRLVGALAFLFLAVAVALHFRLDLVNRYGPGLAADVLGAPVAFRLDGLDWRETYVARLDLGGDRAVVLDGVRLAYDPWQMRLNAIEIDRVTIAAAVGERFSLGDLDPAIDQLMASAGEGSGSGFPPDLPRIVIKSLALDLRSPIGAITGSGEATLDNQAVVASLSLQESHDAAEIEGVLALSLREDGAPPSGTLRMRLTAGSALWPLVGLNPPQQGVLALDAQIRADQNWQHAGGIEADWRATATDFRIAALPAPLSGSIAARTRLEADSLAIRDLAGDLAGGAAADWRTVFTGDLQLREVTTQPQLAGRLSLQGQGGTLPLAPLGAGDITLTEPAIALMVDLVGATTAESGAELTLRLAEPATVSLRKLTSSGQSTLPQATTLQVMPADVPLLHLRRDKTGHLVSTVTAPLAKTSLTVEPGISAERLILAMPRSDLTLTHDSAPAEGAAGLRVDFKTQGAQAVLPTRGIALGGIAIAASHSDGRNTLSLTSDAVTGLGAFVPVRAEAKANLAGSDARFDLRFRGVDQPIDLALKGRADLARLRGEVTLALAPIDFAIGGLQPYNLFPPLRSYLTDISGRIEASGPVRFDGTRLTSDLRLGIEKFSGKVGPVQLVNVNSVIAIDRPWPLSTRPDQAVAVERADIGLPLTGALFRFKVSDGKRLDLAESRLTMSGGEVRMDPVTINFDSPVHNLKLTVTQISVNELFANLGIAGLSGEGTLSGAVPVSLFPGGIAIPAAELKADAPGVLRYDRAQAPLALQSAGESVAMALLALSDFHYKELILRLSRELTGDVDLGLHISGSNPSFYDGYPVEFNLTVQGRLDEALRQGLAGYQVPDMIREQLENLSP
ncbi:dicarboxylate transport [Dongia mobilis]|uniref:Dicarboxylate transport n=1 Tax=Dongia mobilis TaxID=578943 RepID=A0A4R6WUU5_9PROT|nr:YdbH domain-containing protein [Dongia mobilis]TDQ83930.1 dicarboxylate transport [Dongia mobilis]